MQVGKRRGQGSALLAPKLWGPRDQPVLHGGGSMLVIPAYRVLLVSSSAGFSAHAHLLPSVRLIRRALVSGQCTPCAEVWGSRDQPVLHGRGSTSTLPRLGVHLVSAQIQGRGCPCDAFGPVHVAVACWVICGLINSASATTVLAFTGLRQGFWWSRPRTRYAGMTNIGPLTRSMGWSLDPHNFGARGALP